MNTITKTDIIAAVEIDRATFRPTGSPRSQSAARALVDAIAALSTAGFTVRTGGSSAGHDGVFSVFVYDQATAGQISRNSKKSAAFSFEVSYMSGSFFNSETAVIEQLVAGLVEAQEVLVLATAA